ncbi:MAG TPA: enoyl-CoA hydratase-related protein [Solirubrobacterales bacterium]|nr:enoyl-CoA hydratase-related protein [Solirubrobacterales bacterium]
MTARRFEDIRYEVDGPVRLITIDRPERMNAIGPHTHDELVAAWGEFRDDAGAAVAVLTGAGEEAFCAGGDLKAAFEGNPPVPVTEEERAEHVSGEADGCLGPSRWTDIYKPTIAAVNGAAYAGGLEWACWTDLAIADEHASFGVTCRRWNIGLADGGTQRLPRIVGFRRAMELIITGRVIDAAEAERIGLVNEVVPSGSCVERSVELAHRVAELPQGAIRTDKEAAVRGFGEPLDEGLRIEAECFDRLLDSPEIREGLRRFNDRDHPDRAAGGDAATPGLRRGRPGAAG